jgi:hypothetical protein
MRKGDYVVGMYVAGTMTPAIKSQHQGNALSGDLCHQRLKLTSRPSTLRELKEPSELYRDPLPRVSNVAQISTLRKKLR